MNELVGSTERRPNFSFDKMQVTVPGTIRFVDDQSIQATTMENNHVLYKGREYSLTGLSRELGKTGGCCEHWIYEGRNLGEIYDKTYGYRDSKPEGYFLKKVWGFSPEEHPVVGFGKEAGRRKFLAQSNATDQWIVLAATSTEFPSEADKGRLLGMVKVYRQEVDAYETLKQVGYQFRDNQFNNGEYKWPYGLVIREAKIFPDRPMMKDVLGTAGSIHEANFAVPISTEQAASIRQLRTVDVDVRQVRSLEQSVAVRLERAVAYNSNHNRVRPGPVPSYHRSAVELDSNRPGHAYMLKLIQKKASRFDKPVFKIGRSHDPERRCAILNSGLVSAITGCHWEIVDTYLFETEQLAHNFEQLVHKATEQWRVDRENEIVQIEEKQLENHWRRIYTDALWLDTLEG